MADSRIYDLARSLSSPATGDYIAVDDNDAAGAGKTTLAQAVAVLGAAIKTAYEAEADTNAYDDAAVTKLAGIETSADVTDATNVAAAGAPIITSGAGAPSSTPAAVGDIYVDTTGDNVWSAAGTASSADWKQATGAGGGDLLAANNLSDVAAAATAFANIEQAATTTSTGTVELLTTAELDTGTDTTRAATAAAIEASARSVKLDAISGTNTGDEADASATVKGIVELATDAETETGTDTVRATTPANVASAYPKKSILTTKGDILAASAASTPARLAIGTNAQVLTADSAEATGMKWAAAAGGGGGTAFGNSTYSTYTLGIPGIGVHSGSNNTTQLSGHVHYEPFYVASAITVTGYHTYVSAASGTGGTTARLGISTMDSDFQPLALTNDSGTIATDSTGAKSLTGLSISLAEGWYLKHFIGNTANFGLQYQTTDSYILGASAGLTNQSVNQLRVNSSGEHAGYTDPPPDWNSVQGGTAGSFRHCLLLTWTVD